MPLRAHRDTFCLTRQFKGGNGEMSDTMIVERESAGKAAAATPDGSIEEDLAATDRCLKLGRLDEAGAGFRRALARDPLSVAALNGLGLAARARGDHTQALQHFSAGSRLAPDNPWLNCSVGNEAIALGDLDLAADAFARALALRPTLAGAHAGLAQIAQKRGDHEATLAAFRAASTHDPENTHYCCCVGEAQLALGRCAAAREAFAAALALHPSCAAAHAGLGQIANKAGDHDAALANFRTAASLEPKNLWLRCSAAAELLALGRFDEAREAYSAVRSDAAQFGPALNGLGLLAQRRGDLEEALRRFEEAARSEPSNAWYQCSVGSVLFEMGQTSRAIEAFERALILSPGLAPAFAGLARIAAANADHEQALANFENALKHEPKNPWFACAAANEFLALDRIEAARAQLAGVLVEHPNCGAAHNAMGRIAKRRGDHAVALDHFQLALAGEPENPWFRSAVGSELITFGRLDEAAEVFTRLSDDSADFVAAYQGLGQIAQLRGDSAAALTWFSKAAQLHPDDPWLPCAVASQLRRLGRHREALEIARDNAARHKGMAGPLIELGHCARHFASPAETLEIFAAATTGEPDNLGAKCAYARELMRQWRLDDAQAQFEAALRQDESCAEALMGLGAVERQRGSYAAALPHLQAAAQLRHPGAPAEIANLFATMGDFETADCVLEDALRQRPGDRGLTIQSALAKRSRGDTNGALRLFDQCAQQFPGDVTAIVEACRDELALGQVENVLARIDRALDAHPKNNKISELVAEMAMLSGRVELARDLLEQLLRDEPKNISVALRLSKIEAGAGHSQHALTRLFGLRTYFGSSPEICSCISSIFQERGDHSSALGEIDAAIAKFPSLVNLRLQRLALLLAVGDVARAERSLEDEKRISGGSSASALSDQADPRSHPRESGDPAERNDAPAVGAPLAQWPSRQGRPGAPDDPLDPGNDIGRFNLTGSRSGAAKVDDLQWCSAHISALRWDFAAAFDEAKAAVTANPADASRHFFLAKAAMLSLEFDEVEQHLKRFAELNAFRSHLQGVSHRREENFLGQLWEEHRLNPKALNALRETKRLDGSIKVSCLLKLVSEFRTYTPIALQFFVAARRNGDLATNPGVGLVDSIPRKIAQFWDREPMPADIAAMSESWKINNPGYEYRRFSDGTAREFLITHFNEKASAAFDRAYEPAKKADLFRLAYLYIEGGYYVDIDDLCVAPIDLISNSKSKLLLYQEDMGSIGNNFIGAAPGDERILVAFWQAAESILRGDREMLWLSTGPGLMTRIAAKFIAEYSANCESGQTVCMGDIAILDRVELLKIAKLHCSASYKNARQSWGISSFFTGNREIEQKLTSIAERILI